MGEQPNPWNRLQLQDAVSRPLNPPITRGVDYTLSTKGGCNVLPINKLISLITFRKVRISFSRYGVNHAKGETTSHGIAPKGFHRYELL